jgi:dihydroflavonol-4-reductase
MRALVTGATGLVGGEVIERLLARGDEVRVLVRRPAVADELRRRGVDCRLGDLADAGDLAALVEGADVVVHCAGVVQTMGRPGDLWAVNVEGTERLLAASARAGLRRFHLSSVAVHGHAPSPMAEDAPEAGRRARTERASGRQRRRLAQPLEHGVPAAPCGRARS